MTLFAVVFLLAADPAKLPSDAEITKTLAGKRWEEEHKLANGDTVKGTTGYRDDGTFISYALYRRVVNGKDGFLEVKLTGTWRVKDGTLIETVELSNQPSIKKGDATRDKIIAIDDKSITVKTEKGEQFIKRLAK